jgi:hypothetical protein
MEGVPPVWLRILSRDAGLEHGEREAGLSRAAVCAFQALASG